jgi:hypothetical protein
VAAEGKHAKQDPEAITAARITGRVGIIVAVITAVGVVAAAIVTAVHSGDGEKSPPSSSSPALPPGSSTASPQGPITVSLNDDRSQVIVSGETSSAITEVWVLVGPRPGPDQYWAASTSMFDRGAWTVSVETPPEVPVPFEVKVFFDDMNYMRRPGYYAELVRCAVSLGDRCFPYPPAVIKVP